MTNDEKISSLSAYAEKLDFPDEIGVIVESKR